MSHVFTSLISAVQLSQNLHNPDWVIVDCRFNLTDPEWGRLEYEALHIPHAVFADIEKNLSGPRTPQSGRHPLPGTEQMIKVFSKLGIDSSKQVVAYDGSNGSFATRLWFLLKAYGHTNVAVLDGGLAYWHAQGYPFESGSNENLPATFTGTFQPDWIVTADQVDQLRTDPAWRIIDARDPQRYAGLVEPIDPIAGHIPGALNRFYELNLTDEGLFKTPGQLRSEFEALINPLNPEKTVVYCGSGVTSTHHLLAMQLAGLPLPKLYAGSWSEWIRNPAHPVKQRNTP